MKEYLDTEGSKYKTTTDAGHSHTVEIDSSGNGKTSEDSGHYHIIEDYDVLVKDGHVHHLTGVKQEMNLSEKLLTQFNELKVDVDGKSFNFPEIKGWELSVYPNANSFTIDEGVFTYERKNENTGSVWEVDFTVDKMIYAISSTGDDWGDSSNIVSKGKWKNPNEAKSIIKKIESKYFKK